MMDDDDPRPDVCPRPDDIAGPDDTPLPLRLVRLGLDTGQEHVLYLPADSPLCRAEGFAARARIRVHLGGRSIIATIHQTVGDLLPQDAASLSEAAWRALAATEGNILRVTHPQPLESLAHVRAKLYGRRLDGEQLREIVKDIDRGRYSDIDLSAFISACAGQRMDPDEILGLTRAMTDVGDRLEWGREIVVDKHSVGGLPGNRTTPIVVPIAAANGLTMPKTSSRAITSPAGTADTMETLAPVELDRAHMRAVVERRGACIVWGGSVRLSPVDDVLIVVERALDIDSEGQLVASVLSKKIAAGSTHLVLDMPIGATAKIRSEEDAARLTRLLADAAETFGLTTVIVQTDGQQPVGRGIGPALEARDVLAVLREDHDAPQDLRRRALLLAGHVLEIGGAARQGEGPRRARETLESGAAWDKFQEICDAQGGMRTPPHAPYRRAICAAHGGHVGAIDNRRLAKIAKLAGAPADPAAGVELHVRLAETVLRGQPLFTIHAESAGELAYAREYADARPDIFMVSEP